MDTTDALIGIGSVLIIGLVGACAALIVSAWKTHSQHVNDKFTANERAHDRIEDSVREVASTASRTDRKLDYVIAKHGFEEFRE